MDGANNLRGNGRVYPSHDDGHVADAGDRLPIEIETRSRATSYDA